MTHIYLICFAHLIYRTDCTLPFGLHTYTSSAAGGLHTYTSSAAGGDLS